MLRDGKYIYCIIASDYDLNLGPIGIGGNSVSSVGFDGLCMVVSNHPITGSEVNSVNLLTHQKVIEAVMKEYDSVLPIRFGTIASTPDEIRNLLERRSCEFKDLLQEFENKIELNVRGTWKDMSTIYNAIDKNNSDLQNIRIELAAVNNIEERDFKINKAGKLVTDALIKMKHTETEPIIDAFRKSVYDFKHNKTDSDNMFMNTAFLINSGREIEFDNIMADLGLKYQDSCDFVYTAPLPNFNFIDLKIFPERWEL